LFRDVWRETNKIIDYIREISPVAGRGVIVSRTANGTLLHADAAAEAGSKVQQFKLKEVFGDYIRCHSWDGTTEGQPDVFIAKPFRLRRDPFDQQTIVFDDYTASFSYTNNTKRTSTIDGVAEEQVVVPHYKPDLDIIYAIDCDGLAITTNDDEPISMIDLNLDGRAWAGPRT
jgi:hypothetical protein